MAYQKDDFRMERASATGGLLFNDPKEGEMLRRSLQYLIQRVSGQVMSGNINFTRMSMPVHLNEPRSLLERITDDWAHATHFLPAAAASTDPVERIKLVAAFVVSGLHCIHTLGKPFNPILGSTYSATLPDGTPCYIEQTSHHPPVTHYIIKPESGSYILAGFSGIDGRVAWGLDTGLSSRRIGMNVVQFADGTRIVYTLPRMLVRGLAAERKCEYQGPFSVFYEDHDLVFDFLLDPPQPLRWSPFRARTPSDYMDGVLYRLSTVETDECHVSFSGAFKELPDAFFGNPDAARNAAEENGCKAVELRTDSEVSQSVVSAIRARNGAGRQTDAFERKIVSYARGTFLGYLDVDGERLWDIRETPKGDLIPADINESLRSDCRHREDVIALRKAISQEHDPGTRDALTEEAQMFKENLENIQRNDRRLRREGVLPEREENESVNDSDTLNTPIAETENARQNYSDNEEQRNSADGECNNSIPENVTNEEPSSTASADEEASFFPVSLGGL